MANKAKTGNTQKKAVKTKASDMFILVLFAYLTLLVQPIVQYIIQWTPIIDRIPLGDALWSLIMHVVCIAAWTGLALWLMKLSRKECGYEVLEKTEKPEPWRLATAGGIAALFVAASVIVDIFIGEEFSLPIAVGGAFDVLRLAVYYIFLAFNVGMFILVIAFGQKACEVATGKRRVPWGGIVLGACLTISKLISGFMNMTSAEDIPWIILSAVVSLVCAVLYGTVYKVLGNRTLYAAPFIIIMYIML